MDLSNKSLAMLLLAAIIISLGGTMISLNQLSRVQLMGGEPGVTGFQVTPTGTTNLSIQGAAGCDINTNVDFGSGPTQASIFTISSDRDNTVDSFNNCAEASNNDCEGMHINNTGNTNLNVSFNATPTGAGFMTSPSAVDADFQFMVDNGTFDNNYPGCVNSTGIAGWSDWDTVPSAQTWICYNLTFTDNNDVITLEYNVSIRNDEPSGQKTTTINVLCNEY